GNPNSEADTKEIEESAKKVGLKINVQSVGSDSEIEAVFANLQATEALLVATDPFLDDRRERVVALIARQRIPAIYGARGYTLAGGLISYGTNFPDTYRQSGIYAGRILSGAKPGDLPVLQPIKFELVLNLKTSSALDLTIPQSILLRTDEV